MFFPPELNISVSFPELDASDLTADGDCLGEDNDFTDTGFDEDLFLMERELEESASNRIT